MPNYPRCQNCRRAIPELYEPEHLCGRCLNESIDKKEAARPKGAAGWPRWCGQCDHRRQIEWERDGRPVISRCPRCHPLATQPLPHRTRKVRAA